MPATVLRCGTLFDGTGAVPSAMRRRRDRRRAHRGRGPAATTPAPAGAEVVDWSDRFVMPGLIDCHSHASIVPGLGDQLGQLCRGPVPQALPPRQSQARPRRGHHHMRIMGEEHFLDLEVREAIAAGVVPGPRLLVRGRGLAANNGHGGRSSGYDGVDEVRRGARENLRRGADHVKIFVTGGVSSPGRMSTSSAYSRDEIRAAVEEADRAGTYTAAHAHGGPGLRLAVEEGVGTIEHGALADDEDIALMVERRTWLICTFGIFLHPTGIEQGDGRRPAIMEKMRWARRLVDERFPRHLASGVRFACGTDSMHGLMPFELATLVRSASRRGTRCSRARAGAPRPVASRRGGDDRGRQARRPDRDRRRSAAGHRGDGARAPRHEGRRRPRRSLGERG